jgi:hypothetical protein
MTDYFGEETRQVEPSVLVAFGIQLESRHAQASELIELMQFAEAAARRKVSHYVKRAFYHSTPSVCSLELDPSVKQGDAVATMILDAATLTIRTFIWFGRISISKDRGIDELLTRPKRRGTRRRG